MNDVLQRAANQASWNRMRRVSMIEPSAKQKEAEARWNKIRDYGGTHGAKARVQAEFQAKSDAIDAERRKQEQARWLVKQDRLKNRDTIKGELLKVNATGAWQAKTAEETAYGAIKAAEAPYSVDAREFAKQKDALDAAREEKQHLRALEIKKMDEESAKRSAEASAAMKQAELENAYRIEKEKTNQEVLKSGNQKQKDAFARYKDLSNLRMKAENSGLDGDDLVKLDAYIDSQYSEKSEEERMIMKRNLRTKSRDPQFIQVLTDELERAGKEAGLTSY